MKASVLKAVASLLVVAWLSTGCAIFQSAPPAAPTPTKAEFSQSNATSAPAQLEGEPAADVAAESDDRDAAAAEPNEDRGGILGAVDRIVNAIRGDQPAQDGEKKAAVLALEGDEASEESEALGAAVVEEEPPLEYPPVGAGGTVQSETVDETGRDWMLRYGLPILAGILVLHFIMRLASNRKTA